MRVLIFGLVLAITSLFSTHTHAVQIAAYEATKDLVDKAGQATYGSEYDQRPTLYQTIGNILRILLQLLAIIFILLTIYAGFLWMTAGGNQDSIDKAKALLAQAVIGLVIILAAYSITLFVFENIGSATDTNFDFTGDGQ